VDWFILVEATLTHSGKKKPLYYELYKNEERFQKFSNKIIHIIDTELCEDPLITEYTYSNQIWKNENHQRNAIHQGIQQIETQLSPTDYIIISDVDEIPNPALLRDIKMRGEGREEYLYKAYSLKQELYYYNLTCLQHIPWCSSKMIQYRTYRDYFKNKPNEIRLYNIMYTNNLNFEGFHYLDFAGWHLSYFGDVSFIQNKIKNFAHQELNNSNYNSNDYLEKCIRDKKCFINPQNENIQYVPIESNANLPYMYDVYLTKFLK
jgi:beta-1,4-mannosyl-glycoprotein beta-1,4-N-acetylglucosaminyltransferase